MNAICDIFPREEEIILGTQIGTNEKIEHRKTLNKHKKTWKNFKKFMHKKSVFISKNLRKIMHKAKTIFKNFRNQRIKFMIGKIVNKLNINIKRKIKIN